MKLDVVALINDATGISEINGRTTRVRKALMDAYGEAPDIRTIQKWVERNSIPGTWSVALVAISAEKTKRKTNISKYLLNGERACSAQNNTTRKDIFGVLPAT
ncbi:hypothetical protein [Polycladidibacter hongkongensis]|uniref:hypothetical protein n=1 Tax=Polycladidibacter hongkongensis TaxID=1647556 RepID=UPI00082D6B27|nr:hypothetical protein [Pseudovibrio hongkongensis]